eukprot:Skav203708  [mRNA]  locus=scaffold259:485555:487778:- [translate_table: standard]
MNPGPLDGLVPKAWRSHGGPPSPMGLVPTTMAPVAPPTMAPTVAPLAPMTPQNFLSPPAAMPWGGGKAVATSMPRAAFRAGAAWALRLLLWHLPPPFPRSDETKQGNSVAKQRTQQLIWTLLRLELRHQREKLQQQLCDLLQQFSEMRGEQESLNTRESFSPVSTAQTSGHARAAGAAAILDTGADLIGH